VIYGANGVRPGVWIARRRRPRRRGSALVLVLLGIALGGGLAYGFGGGVIEKLTRVRRVEITVTGPGILTEEEVRGILNLPAEVNWRRLDATALEARLCALPRVASARIGYVWFQRLIVSVEERAAVAMVVSPEGRVLEVATDGLLLEPRAAAVADLPLLTWEAYQLARFPDAGEVLDLPGAPDLTNLLRRLQVVRPELWSGISEAHLCGDGTYELFWNDAPTVVWGRGRMGETRLQAWATVMEDLRRRGERDVVVDLRYRDQVVVRRATADVKPSRRLG
jgi:cell division septal protein FtsQ